MGKTMKGLVKNKPLIAFLVAALAFMVVLMLVGTVNVYLFKDYFTSAQALSLVGLLQSVVVFVAMPFISPLVKKFGKKRSSIFRHTIWQLLFMQFFTSYLELSRDAISCRLNNRDVWLWCI